MKLSNSEILFGIAQCYARLNGELSFGIMTREMTVDALNNYKSELKKRGFVI